MSMSGQSRGYWLVAYGLHAKSTDSLFCQIDLNQPEGRERIKKAIDLILKDTY
jgi:hypothetical protein